jgi:uncharacterized membrane protein YdjX (TVP38/TMEM64 family)
MKFRKITFCLWLILVMGIIITYFLFPEIFSLSFMEETAVDHPIAVLMIYYLIISFKGLTFMPGTPILLAGMMLFSPVEVFFVNMAGIMTSTLLVYYFSKYLEFDVFFETKYNKYIEKIKANLINKELPVIIGWSFIPCFPTDVIVYIGSTLRVNVLKCLIGVFIGEAIINSFYIISITMLIKGSI